MQATIERMFYTNTRSLSRPGRYTLVSLLRDVIVNRRVAVVAGVLVLALTAALVVAVLRARADPLRGDLLVTAGRVFDGNRLLRDGAILIHGKEVAAVGERDQLDAQAKQTIELGANATVLPGFVDLHIHAPDEVALLLLSGGVTTVRDLGAPIADLSSYGSDGSALRILRAGPILTAPGGYPIPEHGLWGQAIALQVDGENQARAAVRRVARAGASVIKIAVERGDGSYPIPTVAEIRAIVEEAHTQDLRVTAHVTAPDDTRLALAGGVDELAHMPCAWGAPGLMREIARRRIPIVGTLYVKEEIRCPAWRANARTFVRAGGTLFYGSDFGSPGTPARIHVDELRLMREAGMTPEAIIRNATSLAGRQTGIANLGSLVRGAPADLVAVRGNPFEDLETLGQPQLVVAAGVILLRNGNPTQALLGGL
jgi:imidazolonepropionase-like amidohydrolase